jgi:hypothetical protein
LLPIPEKWAQIPLLEAFRRRWYYTYADNTSAPGDGQYSVWNNGNAWVITWNAVDDAGWHDVVVKGSNPLGDIAFF